MFDNGPKIDLRNLPEILEGPWFAANNPFNIISGFKKAGIFPLDVNWVKNNERVVKTLLLKSREEIFKHLSQRRSLRFGNKHLLKRIEPLNVSIESPSDAINDEKTTSLRRTLSGILSTVQSHHLYEKRTVVRKNLIDEDHSLPKILTDPARLNTLTKKREEKEEIKIEKQRKQERRRQRQENEMTISNTQNSDDNDETFWNNLFQEEGHNKKMKKIPSGSK